MAHTVKLIESLVPVTQFNRGQASRIFDRLHKESQLIVLKNNQPLAVILSPAEYARLCDIEENYELLLEAEKRLNSNTAPTTSRDDLMAELGISEKELANAEEVIIE